MIKGIGAGGKYTQVVGGQPTPPYISYGNNNPGVGNVRYHPTMNRLEVFDGNTWLELAGGYATVGLSTEAEGLLDWAGKKRDAEQRAVELAKTNPTIADALNTAKLAQEQLDIVMALTKVEE